MGRVVRRVADIRKLVCVVALATTIAAAAPQGAAAATKIGNECTANTTSAGTFVQFANAANPLPLTAPADGVVTGWGTAIIPYGGGIGEKLKVLRPTGVANQFTVIAETDTEPVVSGVNAYDARFPIKAGDRIGVFGSPATVLCGGGVPADSFGVFAGDAAVGSTPTFTPGASASVPLTATIEADADGDGYGDETQDGCPTSKDFQIPCPVTVLDSFAAPGKSSLTVLVTTDNLADVTVTGTVKVKKAKKGGGKGKRKSTKIKLKGGTQTIRPGALAQFKVPYPKALKKALATSKKPLKAELTATSVDVIGRVASDSSKAKLPGTR